MSSLKEAIWWTEYVIRHKGANFIRSPTKDYPLYQYIYMDLILIVLLIIFMLYLILKRIIYSMLNLMANVYKKLKAV